MKIKIGKAPPKCKIVLVTTEGETYTYEVARDSSYFGNVHSIVDDGKHYAFSRMLGHNTVEFVQVTAPVPLGEVIADNRTVEQLMELYKKYPE